MIGDILLISICIVVIRFVVHNNDALQLLQGQQPKGNKSVVHNKNDYVMKCVFILFLD